MVVLRKALLPVFARVNPGDITIRHQWTGKPFFLHSFRHKGYWWHGKRREQETMERFRAQIKPSDVVWEVGAHIGYVMQYFGSLASQVTAFEPCGDNLRYLRRNAPVNGTIVEAAATSEDGGEVSLYTESLTGQNCSLIPNYEGAIRNAANAGINKEFGVERVPAITLDKHAERTGQLPDFVKIDVEGAELDVLQGMTRILKEKSPLLMVEISSRREQVIDLLEGHGYACAATLGPNSFWEKVGREGS